MQYTSKIVLLAVALFGSSALAAPFAGEMEYDVEAREVDNDLSAREFYEMYVEARADPSLDARDLESLDIEAREYLEYLEAREAVTATAGTEPPQTPMSAQPSNVETHEHSHEHSPSGADSAEHKHVFLTKHQKAVRTAKKAAAKKFKDLEFYHNALIDKENKYHHFAVLKYLSKSKNLKKALANKESHYHKAAKRVLHHRKAKVYLASKKNFKKALKHKHHKYHKDAVKVYLSHGDHFSYALNDRKAHFHKAAVHEYLLDTKTRHNAISDEHHPFHKQAVKLQKKLNKHHKSASSAGDSESLPSTPTTATFTPTVGGASKA